MAPPSSKKRKVLDGIKGKTGHTKKKFKKQRNYHSSSEDESDDEPTNFTAVNLADSDDEGEQQDKKKTVTRQQPKANTKSLGAQKKRKAEEQEASDSEVSSEADVIEDDDEGNDSDASVTASTAGRAVTKRNDPTAFSTSISKILATKLPTSARADPVLSRSRAAAQATDDFADEKLDKQARAKLRAEKREELDRGRIRDVRGIEKGQTGAVAEEDKRLRKIAQRGVVKLFNAVRAAQVRGEEAAKAERKKGTVGMGEREKAVNEVSKQGFLELISGKKGKPLNIEEA